MGEVRAPEARSFPLRSPVHERTLGNGLRVIVCEDRRARLAAIVTCVRAGYFDEPDELTGISHVLEHMFFRGTFRRGPGEIARETKALGGYLNASTIYDHTTYYTVVPAAALEQALDIQSDALRNSVIDAGELERELRVIIEEAKRKLDSPGAVARETLYETLFDVHRMRRWRIGTEAILSRLRREDVLTFYRSMYTAPNVVLSLAGDIDAEQAFELVERFYCDMPGVPPARDSGPQEPGRAEFRFRELEGDVRQTHIELGWRTPGTLHEDTPGLDLLGVILGQGRASRLYRGVRERGLVSDIGAGNYTPDDIGVFGISAIGDPADTPAALAAVQLEIERLRAAGVAEHEVERARNMVEARLVRRFETIEGQATVLAEWHARGDWRLMRTHYERLMNADAETLARLARGYLDPERAAVLVYRPKQRPPLAWRPGPLPPEPAVEMPPPPAPCPATPAHARATRVEDDVHFYESNGLTVVVHARREVPLVSLAVIYPGGAVEETETTAGLTALAARTTMKGTATRTAAQIAEEIESLGGVMAPSVTSDAFDWVASVPSRHLDHGLDILADVVLDPSFPQEELERERKASLSEAQQLREDMQRFPHRLFLEAAFEGHAYGLPLEAWERTIASADAETVMAWHRQHVRERHAMLLLVGDVEPDEAAAAAFARFPGSSGAATVPDVPAQWPDGPRARVVGRETAQTAMVLGFPGPARNHPDVDAFVVMSAAVSRLGGPLFEELRSRRSLAYTVSASPIARRHAGAFIAYIATSPEREEEARTGLLEQLERWTVETLPERELDIAKAFLLGSRQIRLQTHGARLGELASALLLGRGLQELRDYEHRIRAVTAERVRDTAARWFDRSRLVQGVVRGTGRSR